MSRIAAIPTLRRPEQTIGNVNLFNTGTRVRIPVTSGQAVTLYANIEFGTWSTAAIAIKQRSGSNPVAQAFASAKTLSAAGVLRFSQAEMVAVDELELEVTAASAAAASAMLHVVTEVPTQAVQIAQPGGSSGGGGGGGGRPIIPGGTDGTDGSDIVIT